MTYEELELQEELKDKAYVIAHMNDPDFSHLLTDAQTLKHVLMYGTALQTYNRMVPKLLDHLAVYITESLHQGEETPIKMRDMTPAQFMVDFGLYLHAVGECDEPAPEQES